MAKSGKTTFRDSQADFERIKSSIASRSFSPIYLLMGEEPYFIDMLEHLLANTILEEQYRAFSQTVVYGKDTDAGAIINLCRQMPMMGSYQVVVVREANQLKKIEDLGIYTSAPCKSTILILSYKGKSVDKRLQFYKHILAKGTIFESPRPYDNELGQWLGGFIRNRGCTIEPKALVMMNDHLGSDITKIANELDKLMTSLPEGTIHITPDHIEQNIGVSKDFNSFELTAAISACDPARAMMIADHLSRNPKDYPLVMVLPVLFNHFQRIFILNYQMWQSRAKRTPMPSDMELCRMMKLNSPFFLNEYRQAAAKYPNKKVFSILGLIRQYDMKNKGMDGISTPEGELLRELLLKIFLLP